MKTVTGLLITGLFLINSFALANDSSLLPKEPSQSRFSTAIENIEMSKASVVSLAPAPQFHITPLAAAATSGDSQSTGLNSGRGRISGARQYLEVAPFTGYTFGGRLKDEETDEKIKFSDSASYGLRVAMDYQTYSQIEFLWSRQETELTGNGPLPEDMMFDLDIDYYHIGGTIVWDNGDLEPFFSGSIGLARFDPDSSDFDSETRFSVGFGGGIRYFPTERLGLYLGARGFLTFFNSEWEVTSNSEGTTARFDADTIWQFQVYTGLVLVF